MSECSSIDFVDGQLGGSLSPRDRGFNYGDGLFETVRLEAGHLSLWALHLARLQEGCRRLAIPLNVELLLSQLGQLQQHLISLSLDTGIVKVTVTPGCGGRGYLPPPQVEPTLVLSFFSLPDYPATNHKQGIKLFRCRQVLSIQPLLAGLKHLNKLEYVLARSEWQGTDCAEGLLFDHDRNLVECCSSNLFLLRGDCLLTPELDLCGVAGVMRRLILEELAPALSLSVEVRRLSEQDLLAADELFVCNSVFGIWPVVAYEASG